jgi:hypothetical protein
MDDTQTAVDSVVNFYSTELRLAAVTELILSHCDNTYRQIGICARYYKEAALGDLFPDHNWINHLRAEERKAVHLRAIEMANADAKNGIARP